METTIGFGVCGFGFRLSEQGMKEWNRKWKLLQGSGFRVGAKGNGTANRHYYSGRFGDHYKDPFLHS